MTTTPTQTKAAPVASPKTTAPANTAAPATKPAAPVATPKTAAPANAQTTETTPTAPAPKAPRKTLLDTVATIETTEEGNENGSSDIIETDAVEGQDAPAEEGRLYAKKYKSVDALEKAHEELQAAYSKKVPAPPEGDYSFEVLGAGVKVQDPERWATAQAALKKIGVSQETFDHLLPIFVNSMQNMRQQYERKYGVPDQAQEMPKLIKHFGSEAKAKQSAQAVIEWAKTNLPPNVARGTLVEDAEGIIFLSNLMNNKRGPTPVVKSASANLNMGDLKEVQTELKAIMSKPDYRKNPVLQRDAEILSATLVKLKGGR